MTVNQIQNAMERAQGALTKLQTALTLLEQTPPDTDERTLHEDTVVKRFEVLFELGLFAPRTGLEFSSDEKSTTYKRKRQSREIVPIIPKTKWR